MGRTRFIGGAGILVLLAALSAGAASSADGDLEGKLVKKRPFSFMLPTKWYSPFLLFQPTRKRVRSERELNYTKDGFSLDLVQFRSRPAKTPFEHTKKALTPEMAPFEMAQLVISDMELDRIMREFRVHENKPVTVCGRPGFRIVYSYTDNGTLAYKSVYYGFQRRNVYYTIRYEAPLIHYFDTYLPTFEKMVRSASLTVSDNDKDGEDKDPGPEPENDGKKQ